MASQPIPYSNGNSNRTLKGTEKLSFDESFSCLSVTTSGASISHPSAAILVSSTNQGVGLSQLTTGQRNSIFSPREGLVVYDTTVDAMFLYANGVWQQLSSIQNISFAINYTGIWSSPQSAMMKAQVIGNNVTLSFPEAIDVANSSDVILSAGSIPLAIRPLNVKCIGIGCAQDNSVLKAGLVRIFPNGFINIDLTSTGLENTNFIGEFSGAGLSGFLSFVVQYDLST